MKDCLFCKIASKELSSKIEYEDNDLVAFKDIHPKAPVHILIVPKKHISSVADLNDADEILMGKMIMVAKKIAEEKGIAKNGYKLIFNVRSHGGQIIDHIHLHLLGGEPIGKIIV